MASGSCSSSAVPTLKWKYDVFLSFRGEDTRYTFLDHLHTALVQKGIFVFKDDEELKTGEPISLELLKAIQESRYAVVVFSENYANSSWCLVELAKIMECHNQMGQKVIPVFYHVDPSDIRGQKNEVAVFFQQHEERFRQELDKVKEWREALTAAANLSGFHISETFKEGESSYIRKIVEEISADIQPPSMESNLVGIDSHMDALNSLLKTEENEEVRIVGIHGMGGIGKTTIAKALFRRIAYKFEGSSFVNDVRENSSSKRDLCALQEQVLKDILMTNHDFNVQDLEDGANMIKARFAHKKVLLVFDDVDDCKQLEFLSATHKSFGPGSRIIITTRNKKLLFGANAKYEPDCLPMLKALELFSKHAFKTDSAPEGYEELSRRAIHYAGYLPLAVKVLGSFFHGMEANVWESAFNRLAKEPNVEIFKTLKLSFDGLGDCDKKIFLDIACFFKGKYVEDVTKLLESCGLDPQIGIKILIEKSLITTHDFGRIGMHDLIQEMGWQIVRESFPNSRLWKLEDIHDSLKNNQNLEKIEAIVMSEEQYDTEEYEENAGFSANVFEHMNKLCLLDIRGRFTSSEPTFFPDNLRWLSWSQYPFSSLSMTHMRKLVHLKVVGGAIKQFWNGQKIMPNLKIVKLENLDYLTTFPDVSGAPNIEELFVGNCMKLVKFHKSLGSHKRISKLEVSSCNRLKSLPSSFEMESLTSLLVDQCSSLERFPDVSGAPNIKYLVVWKCKNLVEFHKSLGSHKRIYRLDVSDCKQLKSLPSSFEMESLESLKVSNCSSIERFPDVSGAPNIEYLLVSNCKNLVEFHKSLGSHKRIYKLQVTDCKRLKSLPSSFEMESLESLKVNNCSSLKRFPYLSSCMVKLSDVELDCCSSIEGLLSSLGYLSSLQCLDLRRFGSPVKINPSMCKEYPEKHGCKENLVEDDTKALESQSKSICLQTLTNLCSLKMLGLSCRPIESEVFLKNLQSFSSLKELDLSGNNNLIQLPATISHLSFLEFLTLNECQRLQILHGIPSRIKELQANNCYSLEKIDDLLEGYDWLREISFVNCHKVLKDEERYLEKMLQESFFKRCAVIDRWISISIPGNKIPRWFKEEQAGLEIRVMIPPNCNKQIKGIAICVVFPFVEWQGTYYNPLVTFYFKKADEVSFPQNQSHAPNSVSNMVLAGEKGNMWLCYRPTSYICQFRHEDLSTGGTLLISIVPRNGEKVIRCAASVIYKYDAESLIDG